MDIKKIVLWLVIIMVVSFAIAGLSFGAYFNSGAWKSEQITFTDEKVLDIKDVNKIVIKSSSSGVRIVPNEDSQVKANFKVNHMGNTGGVPTLKAEVINGVINIEVVHHPGMGFTSISDKLEVAIPASYDKDLSVEVLSGGTTIDNLKLDQLNYKGSSGGFRTQDVVTKNTTVSVQSGSIRMSGFAGDLKVDGSSGGIDIEYKEFKNNNVQVKGKSGSIQLKIPADAQFSLDASTMSGGINCDFPVTVQDSSSRNHMLGVVGKGGGTININTNSGGISINK